MSLPAALHIIILQTISRANSFVSGDQQTDHKKLSKPIQSASRRASCLMWIERESHTLGKPPFSPFYIYSAQSLA
ncbi:hypothetical protein VN23_15230 [Janthinobacterium sp. B9-8]|nr:hypothetical protein VN23_15230 [Janthinobacterium sp. B9-8]